MSASIIYDLIPQDRYITREELEDKSGWKDREIRSEINRLRKNWRTLIISSSSGKGYKRPSTENEVLKCLNESKSREREEREKQKALQRKLDDMRAVTKSGGQQTFDFGD